MLVASPSMVELIMFAFFSWSSTILLSIEFSITNLVILTGLC